MIYQILLIFGTSFVLSYFATKWVIKFAKNFGIIDDPKKNLHPKVIHDSPIPRGGGLAPFIAVLISSLLFLPLDKYLVGILAGASILTATGIIDDKYNIHPLIRLGTSLLAALCPIAAGIGIAFITNPFGGIIDLSHPRITFELLNDTKNIWLYSDLFAIVWIIFMMNMLNMGAKGIDGQLPGVVGIAALVIGGLTFRYSTDSSQLPVLLLTIITAGAFLGFLPWNAYPQKIMPGYSGSTLGGFLLAVLAILATAKVGVLLVTLGIPIADTLYAIVRRISKGKSPLWGDREHLHHKLLDMGVPKKTITLLYWFTTAFLGVIALQLNTQNKLYAIVGIFLVFSATIIWITQKTKQGTK